MQTPCQSTKNPETLRNPDYFVQLEAAVSSFKRLKVAEMLITQQPVSQPQLQEPQQPVQHR